MDGEAYTLHWEDDDRNASDVVACEEVIYNTQSTSYSNIGNETIIEDTDQMAAENLMFLSQDVVSYTDNTELDGAVECVTEEVITDDWVPGGQDRVEVSMDQFTNPILDIKQENDIDVPLPTDQDEYTAMRPWPCDFCSRRFRKKAALMNHMVAHQNDRPHVCNLCGLRYVRKSDLIKHLKVHASVPENLDYEDLLDPQVIKPKKKRGRRKKNPEPEEDPETWENMTSARTQMWSRSKRERPITPPTPPSPASPPTPDTPSSPRSPPPVPPSPVDPTRPFVCKHCGVGFAREKALQSHARIHGGESPLECNVCGELCWSRESLNSHTRRKHPNVQPRRNNYRSHHSEVEEDDDEDFRLSPEREPERPVYDTVRGPELFCQHCGVAFQRADLLRRHVAAAHSYKRARPEYSHSCSVCGESCSDALSLLAHAERHAEPSREPPPPSRVKIRNKSRSAASSNMRQFPCKECGKVFGSRSSQQIHIRIHTGERPYACRFCWKAFADGGTLRKHERIHTGEKPYACAVCPRAFNQRVVLREHVRSHHSAPDLCADGPSYCCAVCGRRLHTSTELVQHLIQHCDANTALKRQPQSGPRKYKRRKKIREVKRERSPSESPQRDWTSTRRKRTRANMIHTEETKSKFVRTRRPPRRPADDLRAIQQDLPESPPVPKIEKIEPEEPAPEPETSPDGPYRCEMCDLRFIRRDALLLHVPIHI